MKIYNGQPGELVTVMTRFGSQLKRENFVRFDQNGEYVVPEEQLHKFNSVIIEKLKTKGYKVDHEYQEPEAVEQEDWQQMNFFKMKSYAKKLGFKKQHALKEDIVEYLRSVT